jgi:glycosyltransferase involved in cell wall biosynthesis
MKIAIVTDAWHPQVNGVVRTLSTTVDTAKQLGHSLLVVEPSLFKTIPCPSYPDIRLAWRPTRRVESLVREYKPDAIHIATEGPLGYAARKWCIRNGFQFTTSYHTQFPEYVRARYPIPITFSYWALRQFHSAAARTMVATPSLQQGLEQHRFRNLARWSRGVNLELFQPYGKGLLDLPRPIALYAGRVAVEKNIEAFLQMKFAGTKVVVGDGPARTQLQQRFPDAIFLGFKHGEDLARTVAAADVFVFPSKTDTFGLVLLEAMACGVPIAAYPVTGPIDVVRHDVTGMLDPDLSRAAHAALTLDPADCRKHALQFTWQRSTEQFLSNLQQNLSFKWNRQSDHPNANATSTPHLIHSTTP